MVCFLFVGFGLGKGQALLARLECSARCGDDDPSWWWETAWMRNTVILVVSSSFTVDVNVQDRKTGGVRAKERLEVVELTWRCLIPSLERQQFCGSGRRRSLNRLARRLPMSQP